MSVTELSKAAARRSVRPRTEEQLHTRAWRVAAKASLWQQQSMHGSLFFFFFFKLPEGTTSIHLLEKAGDVVFAAGRPGEGVGVGCYVGGHQFGRLVAFGTAGIPNPVMVHPKTIRHKIK